MYNKNFINIGGNKIAADMAKIKKPELNNLNEKKEIDSKNQFQTNTSAQTKNFINPNMKGRM